MHRNQSMPLHRRVRLCLIALLAFSSLAVIGAEPSPPPHLIASSEPEWPQFRGPRRDGISDERALLPSWPPGGPKLLWTSTNLGRGFSSPILTPDRIFLTGDRNGALEIYALDLAGRPVWQTTNGASWNEQFPGSRAAVTFSAGKLYHENAHGRVCCLDASSGKELWSVNLLERFGGRNITWGMSECLLVDERNVYATAGGRDAMMVALDKSSGELRWKSPPMLDAQDNDKTEGPSYASPILVAFAGKRLLLGCSLRHVLCLDADNGQVQWTRPMPTTHSVLALMPVLVGESIFLTAPHGDVGRLYQLQAPARANEPVGVKEVWSTRLDSLQGGAVCYQDRLYGAYYANSKGWAALDPKTGQVLYGNRDFAKGSILAADGRLYLFSEDGWMRLVNPQLSAFELTGEFRLVDAKARDAWAHPVINRGRLYLRYHETLFCYDIQDR